MKRRSPAGTGEAMKCSLLWHDPQHGRRASGRPCRRCCRCAAALPRYIVQPARRRKRNSPQRHKEHKGRHKEKPLHGPSAWFIASPLCTLCVLCVFVVNSSSFHLRRLLVEHALARAFRPRPDLLRPPVAVAEAAPRRGRCPAPGRSAPSAPPGRRGRRRRRSAARPRSLPSLSSTFTCAADHAGLARHAAASPASAWPPTPGCPAARTTPGLRC